ncbi:uncharacterized protein [Prorops nasuta]|uniref:uncharacterized protein isoform X2 n=1 Tax=Prorops nasuta TaxID=863751 RepID=UPI0034CD42BA
MIKRYSNEIEDEDVVFEGTDLHTHLYKEGFTDFESISIARTQYDMHRLSMLTKISTFPEAIVSKTSIALSWILQRDDLYQKYFKSILRSRILLNEHASTIYEYLERFSNISSRVILKKYGFVSSFTALTSLALYKFNKTFATVFASTTVFCILKNIFYNKYSFEQLEYLILLQNEMYDLCKKSLNILRNGFDMKVGSKKFYMKFSILSAHKLQYLQPLVESLVKYLEILTLAYYKASVIIVELLPKSYAEELLVTKLNYKSIINFINGELDYQAIKELYQTYMLVQSEVLYLLATAYNNITLQFKNETNNAENKLYHIIFSLNIFLKKYKIGLSRIITDYYNCQGQIAHYQYSRAAGSKWQDACLHLELTCQRIQIAYNHLTSILADIENLEDDEKLDIIMNKMNEAQKQIDTVRNFAEFSTLLITKIRCSSNKQEVCIQDLLKPEEQPESCIVHDTEPEIIDEVFEEYIKNEYIGPLCEINDEDLSEQNQLDKLLAKNFMSELKEALIDKQISMSERESIALKRMYKNIVRDSNSSTHTNISSSFIPVPPPMPNFNISIRKSNSFFNNSVKKSNEKKVNKCYENHYNINKGDESQDQGPLFSTLHLGVKLPPSFKVEEETFIGSGENSEEEIEGHLDNNIFNGDE